MFLIKKFTALFLSPMSITLIILASGLFLLWRTRKRKAAKIVITIAAVLFVLFSYDIIPSIVLGNLESKYPPLDLKKSPPNVGWIVVLGSGSSADSRFPVTSQLKRSSLCRLIEGIRIHRTLPESKLVLTGGNPFNKMPSAILMETLIKDLDIPVENLMLVPTSKDTKDEARILKHMIGKDPFILVTSASHMYRSMALCRRQGMNPIAAPTDHIVIDKVKLVPASLFPNASSIKKFEIIFHEYLGILWAKWNDQI